MVQRAAQQELVLLVRVRLASVVLCVMALLMHANRARAKMEVAAQGLATHTYANVLSASLGPIVKSTRAAHRL